MRFIKKGDLTCLINFMAKNPNHNRSSLAYSIMQTWDDYHKVKLYGKQAVCQSFMMKDLEGRNILAYTVDSNLQKPFFLIEGGYKLFLDEDFCSRTKFGYRDMDSLSLTDLDTIYSDPVYTYGECYMPQFLFQEWRKVLDYVLATSDIKWTTKKLKVVDEVFLNFMKKEICDVIKIDSMRDMDLYYQVYLTRIKNIKKYFAGNEEAIISKDYFLLLRTRRIYIEPLIYLVRTIFPNIYHDSLTFSLGEYKKYLQKLDFKNISEKGKNLENLAAYLLNCTKEFKVTGKREKTNRGELDVCCCNISNDSVLWKLGAFIFVECKNWNRKVNVKVIRELGYIMFNKGNSTTILFSSNGITKDAKKEIRKLAVKSKFIIHIDKNNLEQFQSAEDFVDFIKYKYFSLQKETENDLELLG